MTINAKHLESILCVKHSRPLVKKILAELQKENILPDEQEMADVIARNELNEKEHAGARTSSKT